MMRILIAQVKQETNTFCEVPTTLRTFSSSYLYFKEEIEENLKATRTEIGGFLQEIHNQGGSFIPTVAASAISGGSVVEEDYQILKQSILEPLKQEINVDGVLLSLHGAMVTDLHEDPEGDIIESVRFAIGADIPIAVSIDPHAYVSKKMLRYADIIVAYKTFPHIDQYETGLHTAKLLFETLSGKIKPVMRAVHLPMLISPEAQVDSAYPMKDVLGYGREFEKNDSVLSTSICPVQPWLDLPNIHSTIITICDENDPQAIDISKKIAAFLWEKRNAFMPERYSPEEAVRTAIHCKGDKPVALVEPFDSTLAGAPGNSVTLLKALLEQETSVVSYITIIDPITVEQAFQFEEGSEVDLSVGVDQENLLEDTSLSIRGTLYKLKEDASFYLQATGVMEGMGNTAIIKIDNIYLVICSNAFAHQDPNSYRSLDLDISKAKIIGIKSTLHFRAFYSEHVQDILFIEGKGVSSGNFFDFNWKKINRPIWPLDEENAISTFEII